MSIPSKLHLATPEPWLSVCILAFRFLEINLKELVHYNDGIESKCFHTQTINFSYMSINYTTKGTLCTLLTISGGQDSRKSIGIAESIANF